MKRVHLGFTFDFSFSFSQLTQCTLKYAATPIREKQNILKMYRKFQQKSCQWPATLGNIAQS